MAPVDDAVHRGDVPPPIDLAGHMRELGRALLPAVVIALLVGAAVFYVRSEMTDKEYSASIVTEIKPAQTLVPGDAFIEQLRAPFIELTTDTDVLARVLSEVDTDMDAATLSANTSTTPGTSPALLEIGVTAGSPELAQDLVRSMVSTVAEAANANYARDTQGQVEQTQATVAAAQARVTALPADDPGRPAAESQLAAAQDQLSQLQSAGGDQLVVLSSPEQSTEPVAPKPVSEALVAALAALVIAAELIVLLRGRFGSKPSRPWARRTSRKYSAKFDAAADGDLPPSLDARIATLQRERSTPSTNARHAAPRSDAVVVVLVGDNAVYRPRHGYAAETSSGRRAVETMSLTDEWWRVIDVSDVDSAVVLVSKSGRDRKPATRALARLREFGVSSYLVLQSEVRDRPKESAAPKQNAEVDSHVG